MSQTQILVKEYNLLIQSFIKESLDLSDENTVNLYRNKIDFVKSTIGSLLDFPINEDNSWVYNEIKNIIEEVKGIESESPLSFLWNRIGILFDYIYLMNDIKERAG